ncbi:MAG: hypothetical protein ABW136_12175 [Steroidobacteraceae bacterium]
MTEPLKRTLPIHRQLLLWASLIPLTFVLFQTGMRLWLLKAGEPVVGEVTVAQDSCISRHRANCFLGRAVVNPRMEAHRFSTTKISGGRFYTVKEEVPMRVYPAQRLYLAQVYTPLNWLLGPVRSALVFALLLLAAAMPAARKALWIAPLFVVAALTFG